MSATPFLRWEFPAIGTADGHAQRISINKGMLGYNPVGGAITASQCITLNGAFLPLDLGDFERQKHDIYAVPQVPKISITLNDVYHFWGISNSLPVDYDLSGVYSSLIDEIFDDPTLVYEVWIDDFLAGTLNEVWFVGDVDQRTIPMPHKTVVGEGTTSATRQQEATLSVNFAIDRLQANKQRTSYSDGVNWVSGSVMDMAYNFKVGGFLAIWDGGVVTDTHSIYCGSAPPYPYTNNFGQTGPANTGLVRGYGFPANKISGSNYFPVTSPNIRNISLTKLAELIAYYAGFANGTIDTNMMFDLYSQAINNPSAPVNWPLTLQAGPGPTGAGTGNWSNIYVNANFLFGNGITIANSYKGAGINLSGTVTGTAVYIQGTFYDWGVDNPPSNTQAAFNGSIAGGGTTINLTSCEIGGAAEQEMYAKSIIYITGTIAAGVIHATANINGATVNLIGTLVGGAITLQGAGPLLFQWGSTIDLQGDALSLVSWICMQTGTWLDTTIDTSGDVSMVYRSRRAVAGASLTYFAFTNLSEGEPLISGSGQEPGEIPQSSVTVQCKGNDLTLLAGGDESDAVALTMPWQCHKFGSPNSNSGMTIFFGANPIEQWWDHSIANIGNDPAGNWASQAAAVTVDAKLSDNPSDNSGLNDDTYTAPPGDAVPTVTGWVGSGLLLWLNTAGGAPYVLPFGEYLGASGKQTSNDAAIAIAAILPAGMSLPTDEMLGGYFNPQQAACQVYFMEMTAKDGRIILVQDYIGCRGDDGKIQSLRPGLLMRTFIRNAYRTFEAHNVKSNVSHNTCTIQWHEVFDVADYNAFLPDVTATNGSGSSSSSSSSSTTGGSTGGGTAPSTLTFCALSIAATVNDYAPVMAADIYLVTSTDSTPPFASITGFKPILGRRITFLNVGTNPIVFPNQSSGSIAANRWQTASGADVDLLPNQNVSFWYNSLAGCYAQINS